MFCAHIINDNILNKPGKLTEEEWIEMKKHPEIGYRIAMSSPELAPIAEYILCHHEHWDGSGYPDGLAGEHIPLLARILQVVDAYDALTTSRPYKPALSHDDSERTMRLEADRGLWDKQVVDTFFRMRLAQTQAA